MNEVSAYVLSMNLNRLEQIKTKKGEIVVGMSGGVDSSMTLVLLKKQGWQPIGVSLKFAVWKDKNNLWRENICCSTESFKIARSVCKKLKVPYYIFDVSKGFKKKVIDYFLFELKNNRTPNPCVICNRYLKFLRLFEWAKRHKIKYVATGHYARIREDTKTGKYELLRAKDKKRDQTYSLCFLPQKWLKYLIFPLGDYLKEEIFQLAKKHGFDFFLKRKQSQDFCFVSNKSMKCFLEKEVGRKIGLIKNIEGKILGEHQGLHFYTIGQRKGIKLPGGPYYVVRFDVSENILMVSKKKGRDKFSQKEILLSPYHLISEIPLKKKIRVKAKIRSQQPLSSATLFPAQGNIIKLIFDKPQRAITPGQYAVFYLPAKTKEQINQKYICLGGGRIK